MTMHAWIITKDHLCDGEYIDRDEAGVCGPSDADEDLLRRVKAGEGKTFRMWDDDGELYYTGRLLTTEDRWGEEDVMVAPLRDFGTPNAGAVLIKWHGHPEWTCEYC
jgi:hypothetical protein